MQGLYSQDFPAWIKRICCLAHICSSGMHLILAFEKVRHVVTLGLVWDITDGLFSPDEWSCFSGTS